MYIKHNYGHTTFLVWKWIDENVTLNGCIYYVSNLQILRFYFVGRFSHAGTQLLGNLTVEMLLHQEDASEDKSMVGITDTISSKLLSCTATTDFSTGVFSQQRSSCWAFISLLALFFSFCNCLSKVAELLSNINVS